MKGLQVIRRDGRVHKNLPFRAVCFHQHLEKPGHQHGSAQSGMMHAVRRNFNQFLIPVAAGFLAFNGHDAFADVGGADHSLVKLAADGGGACFDLTRFVDVHDLGV